MSPPDVRRGRPRQDSPSFQIASPSLAALTHPLDDIARHVDGAFVIVVVTSGGQYRRRCFLTVAAAEKAARNATAAGHNAKVYLAELRPLWQLLVAPSTTTNEVAARVYEASAVKRVRRTNATRSLVPIVENAITKHMDTEELRTTLAVEQSERDGLYRMASGWSV